MVRLALLGLLRHKPMHGYELQTILQQSRVDQWTNILTGSIYHALNKMEEEGLIETVAEERSGARLRKIYGITELGQTSFHEMLRDALKTSPHSMKSDFSLALGWVEELPKEEALQLLTENIRQLESDKAQWVSGWEQKKNAVSLSRVQSLGLANGLELLELDLRFLQSIVDELTRV